jgi:hypothetical protein
MCRIVEGLIGGEDEIESIGCAELGQSWPILLEVPVTTASGRGDGCCEVMLVRGATDLPAASVRLKPDITAAEW